MELMKLGLLVGNSRLRYGMFEGGEVRESGDFFWDGLLAARFRPLKELARRSLPEDVLVGSVREDRLEALRRALRDEVEDLRVAGRDFEIPVENQYEDPAEVGDDRLLNAVAARELWPGCSVVVLDFGTALSVTVVSADGAFLGGLIGVGLGSAAATIRANAPDLPPVRPSRPEALIQRSTEAGLSAGIYWQLVGGTQCIVDGLREELPPPVRVVATGGDAPLLTPGLRGVDRIDGELTLRGLFLAVESSKA